MPNWNQINGSVGAAYDRMLARAVEAHYGDELPEWVACMGCGRIEQEPSAGEVNAANDDREEGEGRTELYCEACAKWDATQPASNPQGMNAEGVGMHGRRWVNEKDMDEYRDQQRGEALEMMR